MIRLADGEYLGSQVSTLRVAGLRITEAVYPPHMRLPRHAHADAYLCMVTSGGFEEWSANRSACCGPGTVVWHPSAEEHEDVFGSHGGTCVNIEFANDWHEYVVRTGDAWTYSRGAAASWLAARVIRELSLADSVSPLAVEGLVCALLAEVHRSSPTTGQTRPAWLGRSLDRLRIEYRNPPDISTLAAEAAVHRSHFVREFQKHVGCTVAELVRRFRIEWAAEELRLPQGRSISDVSLLAGFADQAHFTRTFKRVTGVTPAEYRRRRE